MVGFRRLDHSAEGARIISELTTLPILDVAPASPVSSVHYDPPQFWALIEPSFSAPSWLSECAEARSKRSRRDFGVAQFQDLGLRRKARGTVN